MLCFERKHANDVKNKYTFTKHKLFAKKKFWTSNMKFVCQFSMLQKIKVLNGKIFGIRDKINFWNKKLEKKIIVWLLQRITDFEIEM